LRTNSQTVKDLKYSTHLIVDTKHAGLYISALLFPVISCIYMYRHTAINSLESFNTCNIKIGLNL
jgi:hypothetical protein